MAVSLNIHHLVENSNNPLTYMSNLAIKCIPATSIFLMTSAFLKFSAYWPTQLTVCSDRILTFGIRSIRSPAKVGLVVTELLITSLVVSWRGWETPPPPTSTAAQLSFFAQPRLSEHLSLRGGLPSSSARLCLRLWWMDWTFSSTSNLSILSSPFSYVKGITNLPRSGE